MNGAQALIRTLVAADVDVLLRQPRHLRDALRRRPRRRARDARRARACSRAWPPARPTATPAWPSKPAATLLHLGSGLGNGLANLHNARAGRHPGREHRRRPRHLPQAVRRAAGLRHRDRGPQRVGLGAHRRPAPRTSPPTPPRPWPPRARPPRPGRHADPAGRRVVDRGRRAPPRPLRARGADRGRRDVVRSVADALRSGEQGGALPRRRALREAGLVAAARVAAATRCAMLGETFPARLERGAGLPAVDRLAYLAEFAAVQLDGTRHLVLVDAQVAGVVLRLPGQAPATWCPRAARVHVLATGPRTPSPRLRALAAELAPPARPRASPRRDPTAADRAARRGRARRGHRRAAARGRHRGRRGATPPGCTLPAPPPAAPATTGSR